MNIDDAIREATAVAMESPCAKSKRGVVIFTWREILARGHNHPPNGMACDGSDECRENCNKLCIHAEEDAQNNLRIDNFPSQMIHMLHVKAVDGAAVVSGPPSCWQCSRRILDRAVVEKVWLLHKDGPRCYPVQEFHDLTLQHCHLPVIRST